MISLGSVFAFAAFGCSTTMTNTKMQSTDDRAEITGKMGLYTFAWDKGDPEGFRKINTDDVVFVRYLLLFRRCG
jgi:hypothetical protein